MKRLRVTNIQRGCVYDGPGIRTTIFLKGCSMHCPWCCNPEAIAYEQQWYIDNQRCIKKKEIDSSLCLECERNSGNKSLKECPFGVTEAVSKDYTIGQILDIVKKDKKLFIETRGGVTLSGGEPLLHSEELEPLLQQLKYEGIEIAVETTLYVPEKYLFMVVPYIDYYLIDLKLQPQMKLFDFEYLRRINWSLKQLEKYYKQYRLVFVDEMTTVKVNIVECLKSLNVRNVEILPCHNLGEKKYQKLSLDFNNYKASPDRLNEFTDFLCKNNVETNVLTI